MGADAAYPLVKSIDWGNTGVLDSYLAKTPANKEAILALLNAGLAMDPKMVQGAVRAHLDAVSDVDGSLVTSAKGFEEARHGAAVRSVVVFLTACRQPLGAK